MDSKGHSMSDSSGDEPDIGESEDKESHENKSSPTLNSREEKELDGLVDSIGEWDVVKENGPLTTEDLKGNKELYLVRMPLGMVQPMDLLNVEIKDEDSQIKEFEIDSKVYEAVYYDTQQFQPSIFFPKKDGILYHIQEKLKGQILLRKGVDTSSRVPRINIKALKSVVHSPPSDLKPRAFLQYEADTTKRLGGAVKLGPTSEPESPDMKKKNKKKKAKEDTDLNGNASSILGSPLQKENKGDKELCVDNVSIEEPLRKKKKKKHKEMEASTSTSSASESPQRMEKEESHMTDVGNFKMDSPKKKKRKREDTSLSSTEPAVITGNKKQKLNLDIMEMGLLSKKKKNKDLQEDVVMEKDLSMMESLKKKDKKRKSEAGIALELLELPEVKKKDELDQKRRETNQELDLHLPELTSSNGKKNKKKRKWEESMSDVDMFANDAPSKKKKKDKESMSYVNMFAGDAPHKKKKKKKDKESMSDVDKFAGDAPCKKKKKDLKSMLDVDMFVDDAPPKKKKDKQKLKDVHVDNLSVSLDLGSIELPKKSKKKKRESMPNTLSSFDNS